MGVDTHLRVYLGVDLQFIDIYIYTSIYTYIYIYFICVCINTYTLNGEIDTLQ